MLKKKWGRIVNCTTIGIKFGGGEFSYNYNLAKHCLEFIPNKFKFWAKNNVLINNIRIGHTKTKIHKRIVDIVNSTPKTVESLMKLDLPAGVDIEIRG